MPCFNEIDQVKLILLDSVSRQEFENDARDLLEDQSRIEFKQNVNIVLLKRYLNK